MNESGSMASSMEASAIGSWTQARKRDLSGKGRNFQYTWEFTDGESGFIVQKKLRTISSFKCIWTLIMMEFWIDRTVLLFAESSATVFVKSGVAI